ncbi:hypothetical protein [Jiangella mangrovi]|uniref:Uncharacterized protein n=1 Tax=Jiangella mangrovi TaxID=1524084 RepID=A0A7W9LLS0_9ACTN|nr:hypothetical protein [Jiangella mangrovi]MBB5788382.1 hypothetical protein [Jiangella mangrovi]
MKPRVTLITLCALGVVAATAVTVPAEAGPLDRRISPTAVAPRPIVVDAAPAQLTYSRQARSEWQLTEFDRAGNAILATHVPSGITLAIDYDDPSDDRHAAGIAPDTGCGPMEGQFWGSTTPLLYPILEPETHVIENVTVAMDGDEVRVRMVGGAYDLVEPGAGDEPLFMDAVFTVEDGQLRAHTSGLHYVLPSKDRGTTVDLTLADGTRVSRTFTMASPTGREYLDDVRLVEVSDGRYGDFSWTTDIERLQFDLNTNPLLDVFEIDADHALKDRGQRVVTNDFTFAAHCG